MERLDATLGAAGLLEAVKGQLPAKCLEITLIDLSDIPVPDPSTHPTRDVLAYRKTLSEQKGLLQKRENILFSAKNKAYQMLLATCSPNQQQLHNEIVKECNFGVEVHGRYYADGQRAYEIVVRFLSNPTGRTEEDKVFYKIALRMQEENPLAPHSPKEAYVKMARAYLDYIVPNLPYSIELSEQFEHVLELMPSTLSADKRRIESERMRLGTYDNLGSVIEECSHVVYKDQKAETTKIVPSFVGTVPKGYVSDNSMLAGLSAATGMELSMSMFAGSINTSKGRTLQFAAMTGEPVKWCDKCPHGKEGTLPCDSNPYHTGPMHPANATNPEKKKEVLAARVRNAKDCADLGGKPKSIAPPTQGSLDRWKKTLASRTAWKAGKGKPGGGYKGNKDDKDKKGTTEAAGAAAQPQQLALADFMKGVVDLDDDSKLQMFAMPTFIAATDTLLARPTMPTVLGTSTTGKDTFIKETSNAHGTVLEQQTQTKLFPRLYRSVQMIEADPDHESMSNAISEAIKCRDETAVQRICMYNDFNPDLGLFSSHVFVSDDDWLESVEIGDKTTDARVRRWHPQENGVSVAGPPTYVAQGVEALKSGDLFTLISSAKGKAIRTPLRIVIVKLLDYYDGEKMSDGWARDGTKLIPDAVATKVLGHTAKTGEHADTAMQTFFERKLVDRNGKSLVDIRFLRIEVIAVAWHHPTLTNLDTGVDYVPDCGCGRGTSTAPTASPSLIGLAPILQGCAVPTTDGGEEDDEEEDEEDEEEDDTEYYWAVITSKDGFTALVPYEEPTERGDIEAALHKLAERGGDWTDATISNYKADRASAEAHCDAAEHGKAHTSDPSACAGTATQGTATQRWVTQGTKLMPEAAATPLPAEADTNTASPTAMDTALSRTEYVDATPRAAPAVALDPQANPIPSGYPPSRGDLPLDSGAWCGSFAPAGALATRKAVSTTASRTTANVMPDISARGAAILRGEAYVPAESPELRNAQDTPKSPKTANETRREAIAESRAALAFKTDKRLSYEPTSMPDGYTSLVKVDVDKYSGTMIPGDTVLALDYAQHQSAADLGAKYDRRRRTWYLPKSVDADVFTSALVVTEVAVKPPAQRPAVTTVSGAAGARQATIGGGEHQANPIPKQIVTKTVTKTATKTDVEDASTEEMQPDRIRIEKKKIKTTGGDEKTTPEKPTRTLNRPRAATVKTRVIRVNQPTAQITRPRKYNVTLGATLLAFTAASVVWLCTDKADNAVIALLATFFGGLWVTTGDGKQIFETFINALEVIVTTYSMHIMFLILAVGCVRSTLACGHGPNNGVTTTWQEPIFSNYHYLESNNGSAAVTWDDGYEMIEYDIEAPAMTKTMPPSQMTKTMPPSPPPSPPPPEPSPMPRADMLTREQSQQAYLELLGGNEPPKTMPEELKCPTIVDTGCFSHMVPSIKFMEEGSIRAADTKVQGCGGIITLNQKGNPVIPMPTLAHGIRKFRSDDGIVNGTCPYILIAIGYESIKQGIRLVMPPWGREGYFEYLNGVRVPTVNQRVIFVRPIGYKENPRKAMNAVTIDMLGVPPDGDFMIYLGAGKRRPGDLESHFHGYLPCVCIEINDGGATHDLTDVQVITTLIDAASLDRCRFTFSSTSCASWTAALFLPDKNGNPGRPLRKWPDEVLGCVDENGKIPHAVEMANLEARGAAEICMACVATGGCACAETPQKRRDGVDALPDAKQHAYMLDHPAWLHFAASTGAQVVVFDQCRTLDSEALVATTSPKATALLASAELYPAIKRNFGGLRCNHTRGSHQALRGAVNGRYRTNGSETYSSQMCSLIADSVRQTLGDTITAVTVPVMPGIIQGKKLVRGTADGRFFRAILDHAEHRVMRNVIHAWSDAEPWWVEEIDKIKDEPDDVALRANAIEMPHKGVTPSVEGLLYIDVWHINVPAIHTGRMVRLVCWHPATKFFKSVKMKGKFQAPEAIDVVLCFFASKGRSITWIHCDQAKELKEGGAAKLCKSKNVRITTNQSYEHQNPVEPYNKLAAQGMRRMLTQAGLPVVFHEQAWDAWEEARCMRPSQQPPHDCALGRLQKFRPAGSHQRPFGLLCCVGDVARHPGGTLVNKGAAQAKWCLHFRYSGTISGVGETAGSHERAQPSYICYDAESNTEIHAINVRFIDGVFPGLQRSAGGGWRIPLENIPFTAEALNKKAIAEAQEKDSTKKTTEKHEKKTEPVDLSTTNADELEIDPHDVNILEVRKGFPEADAQDDKPPVRGGEAKAPPPPPVIKAKPAPERYMVPAEQWPDYECNETYNGQKGWEVIVIQKSKTWRRCKFCKATDAHGRPFTPVWRKAETLVPLSSEATTDVDAPTAHEPLPLVPDVITEPETHESIPTIIKEVTYTTEPIPDGRTLPHVEGADPLKEPTRPTRDRRTVDRYSPEAIVSMYTGSAHASYDDVDGRQLTSDTIYAEASNMGHLGERFYGLAYNKAPDVETAVSAGEQAVERFNLLSPEYQVALNVLADYDQVAAELGAASPGAKKIRETYLSVMMEAAVKGTSMPAIDPLLTAIPPPGHKDLKCMRDARDIGDQAAAEIMMLAKPKNTCPSTTTWSMVATDDARVGSLPPKPTVKSFKETAESWDSFFELAELTGVANIFDDKYDGFVFLAHDGVPDDGGDDDSTCANDLVFVAKAKTNPDIFGERQMRGAEWDEPKSLEIATLMRLGAIMKIAADDPRVKHMKAVPTMWTGRAKRLADRSLDKLKGRCVLRGDQHGKWYEKTANDAHAPVIMNTSSQAADAMSCLRQRHRHPFDAPSAYIQGIQQEHEQTLAKPPHDFREFDERGVEILWLLMHPLYGQTDAGAIWNRTFNEFATRNNDTRTEGTSEDLAADVTLVQAAATAPNRDAPLEDRTKVQGMSYERCPYDPCVYARSLSNGDHVGLTIYVDDGQVYHDDTPEARKAGEADCKLLSDRFNIKFGEPNPTDDYFLGANRIMNEDRTVVMINAESYIRAMAERYCDGDTSSSKRFPAHWTHTPADEELVRAHEAAVQNRTPASSKLFKDFNSLVGSLRHVVKYRPEISAAMDLLGCCLTFPTEELMRLAYRVLIYLARNRRLGACYSKHAPNASKLFARADSNWREVRSTSGYCIFLGGAVISHRCIRQKCIAMSSTEAELVALAECAIELVHVIGLVRFLGLEIDGPVEVETDNKGAFDLCHRYTSAQHSRHIDRKLFKMREMRGAGTVVVKHLGTEFNTADLWTKILNRQPFEKHRNVALNKPAGDGLLAGRSTAASGDRTVA